jgi:hypothetical protein
MTRTDPRKPAPRPLPAERRRAPVTWRFTDWAMI